MWLLASCQIDYWPHIRKHIRLETRCEIDYSTKTTSARTSSTRARSNQTRYIYIYIYIYIYRCTCSVRREPILVVDALVSFFESKRQHFFVLFARRVWWTRSISLMDPQWWRSMKAYQRGNSWNHGNKLFLKKGLKPFLLSPDIGTPKNQQLMLLILMTPFMTSMASPNPCTRYLIP